MIIQNAPDSFFHWLYTNAPAAWFSAVAAVTTLVLVLRSRKKPNRIVVRDVSNSSLVRIWPGVRDKITVAFLGRLIQNLGQVDLEIFNEGLEVIKHPSIEIALQGGSTILDLLLTPPDSQVQIKANANKVILIFPYLNPHREHKQIAKVSILLDGRAEQVVVSGGGEGWSSRHVTQPGSNELLDWFSKVLVGVLASGASLGYLARNIVTTGRFTNKSSVIVFAGIIIIVVGLLMLRRISRMRTVL